MKTQVFASKARIKTLERFLFDEVIERPQAFEVSDVKGDGTVFVRFRSVTEASATACAKSFREACEGRGILYTQTEENKFRLALDQFHPL